VSSKNKEELKATERKIKN